VHRDKLKSQVASLLHYTRTLVPTAGTFTSSGRTITLFYLYGVLPINFHGATYNIPVTIYFDPPFPSRPPRCFVTPTTGMSLKAGHPNVDSGGMIYLPYLSNWSESQSTLTELIVTITSVFAERPPVFSNAGAPKQSPPAKDVVRGVGAVVTDVLPRSARDVRVVQPGVAPQVPVSAAEPLPSVASWQPPPQPPSEKERLVQQLTQEIQVRWSAVLLPLVTEANEQLDKQGELESAEARVDDDIRNLQAAWEQSTDQLTKLQELKREMMAYIIKNQAQVPDPLLQRSALSTEEEQVLDLLTEELALEEYLVALDELLSSRKINLDLFVRETREVSRRQFLCKVQREKAMRSLGIPSEAESASHDVVQARRVPTAPCQPPPRVAVPA